MQSRAATRYVQFVCLGGGGLAGGWLVVSFWFLLMHEVLLWAPLLRRK
jgi:hypothetical protein